MIKKSMCLEYHLCPFYLFLLNLIFLELDDVLQALRGGSPITTGTKTRHSHHAQGGFHIYTLIIVFLFLVTLLFNLCPSRPSNKDDKSVVTASPTLTFKLNISLKQKLLRFSLNVIQKLLLCH